MQIKITSYRGTGETKKQTGQDTPASRFVAVFLLKVSLVILAAMLVRAILP